MLSLIIFSSLLAIQGQLIQLDESYDPRLPSIPQNITFEKDFLYGFASAAFQVEGAVAEDGRSPSIWDKFAMIPGKVRHSPNITVDEYHLFNETVRLLKLTGANTYRMSISWTRIVPGGFAGSPVNQKGIDHYNRCFDLLIENGIIPMVSLLFLMLMIKLISGDVVSLGSTSSFASEIWWICQQRSLDS